MAPKNFDSLFFVVQQKLAKPIKMSASDINGGGSVPQC